MPTTPPQSRRALREAQGGRRSRRRSAPAVPAWVVTWAPRSALLTALAAATIAVPLAASGGPTDATVPPVDAAAVSVPAGLPSAYDVLSSTQVALPPTSLLAAVPGAERVSDTASRSIERDPLPGCDGSARPAGENGRIPASDLCAIWDPDHRLRGDAAVALTELNGTFRAAFGRDMCITDSYRSLEAQRAVAWRKPGLAATPGTSNHGWGLAIDLCASETGNSSVMQWLSTNGDTYGWINPEWAQRGGSGPYEPWHWEYLPGTVEMGSNY